MYPFYRRCVTGWLQTYEFLMNGDALGGCYRCHRDFVSDKSPDNSHALACNMFQRRCIALEHIDGVTVDQSELLTPVYTSSCTVGSSHPDSGGMFGAAASICKHALIGLRLNCCC